MTADGQVCSLSDWQIESLRLSAFVINIIDPTKKDFWGPLIGNPPDAVHSRPQQQSVKTEGPLLNGWLSIEASSNRIDWRLSHDPKNPPQELPTVGPYDALLREFQELMRKWLTHCPPINRLAYGAELLLPANSSTDAYRMLNEWLPDVKIGQEPPHDFLYRINRRRPSHCSIEGLKINRLATWSVVRISGMLVDIPASGEQSPTVTQLRNDSFCRLVLDINTAPESHQELGKNITSAVLDELVGLGNEIATEGDIP